MWRNWFQTEEDQSLITFTNLKSFPRYQEPEQNDCSFAYHSLFGNESRCVRKCCDNYQLEIFPGSLSGVCVCKEMKRPLDLGTIIELKVIKDKILCLQVETI